MFYLNGWGGGGGGERLESLFTHRAFRLRFLHLILLHIRGREDCDEETERVCEPRSATRSLRLFGAWRTPPPLVDERMESWTRRHAALCRRIKWVEFREHSPVICVHESSRCSRHRWHAYVGSRNVIRVCRCNIGHIVT